MWKFLQETIETLFHYTNLFRMLWLSFQLWSANPGLVTLTHPLVYFSPSADEQSTTGPLFYVFVFVVVHFIPEKWKLKLIKIQMEFGNLIQQICIESCKFLPASCQSILEHCCKLQSFSQKNIRFDTTPVIELCTKKQGVMSKMISERLNIVYMWDYLSYPLSYLGIK